MKNTKPLLTRDNRHTQIIFFMMAVSLFMLIGTVSLYVKEAFWGLAVLIFLTGLLILTTIRNTDKNLPRLIKIDEHVISLIYWNNKEISLPFHEIESLTIDGYAGKSISTIFTIKTQNDSIKIVSEIFDTTAEIITTLKDKTKIEYKNQSHENAITEALKSSKIGKICRLSFAYFLVAIFSIIAFTISLNLPAMVH